MKSQRYRMKRRRRFGILLAVIVIVAVFTVALKYQNRELLAGNYQTVLAAKRELSSHNEYPESLAGLLESNPETAEFVRDYGKEHGVKHTIDLKDEISPGEIPLFIQWDKRWGYEMYGNEMIAVDGCGPASLAMVLAGLTQDASWSPLRVAEFAQKNGYYVDGSGSSWSLMSEGAESLGLRAEVLTLDEGVIRSELEEGHPIICIMGPGDFTSSGHFIVLAGINDDGTIKVNDSNSRINSKKGWDLDKIMGQIRNLWSYSL